MALLYASLTKRLFNSISKLGLLFFSTMLSAQSMDIDYDGSINKEKRVRVKIFKSIGAGVNSQGVVEVTSEVLSIDADLEGQVTLGLSVFGNRRLFGGNLNKLKTRVSHLLYPFGGDANGQLHLSFPLARPINPIRFVGYGGVRLLNSGLIMPRFQSSYYTSYGAGFSVHQQLKTWESQDKTKSGAFWAQPTLNHQWMSTENSAVFYDSHMNTSAWHWGLQAGLEWNRKLRLTLFVNQYLTKQGVNELNAPLFRVNFIYRFVPRPKKIQMLELN